MGINVLSCFDGISVGQLALQRAGIEVDNYYASEIDKYAIAITQKNFPNTIQLGDIECWKNWNLPKIDLLIAGSPCQGFSNAGLGLNFEDPRSKLFFVFRDILEDRLSKNTYLKFLLENVRMKKEWKDVITEHMRVEPVLVNSALVSAQERKRLYWANWEFPQPEDRFIFLKDVLGEDGEVDREKSYCLDANYHKGGNPKRYFTKSGRQLVKLPDGMAIIGKSKTVRSGGINSPVGDRHEWDCVYVEHENFSGIKTKHFDKSVALRSSASANYQMVNSYRRLSVIECERLQTLRDGFTEIGNFCGVEKIISNTQRYKCIGNSWTADVVSHILSFSGL